VGAHPTRPVRGAPSARGSAPIAGCTRRHHLAKLCRQGGAGKIDAYDGLTDPDIDRKAGWGGHEIRCWIAAGAAMGELGGPRPRLDYYRLVPEWITGMSLMIAEQT
jgi:hypothetical protein